MYEKIKMMTARLSSVEEENFRSEVLAHLAKIGGVGEETVSFIQTRNVQLKFRKQRHSAASWTLNGDIHIDYMGRLEKILPNYPYLLSLVVHETRHLKQGILTALSVYGELDAWQTGFSFYKEISSSPLDPVIEEILLLPLDWSRGNLAKAAILMKKYSPMYRINLLPLYPLHREIVWRLTRKEPK
jgi:hypothetical protein